MDVQFTNWRGIVAPPGLSDPDRDKLIGLFRKLHETREWQDALRLNGWSDAFQVGAKYRLRRALQISDGSLTGLVNSPMAIVVYAIIAVLLAWPLLRMLTRKRTAARERAGA